MLTGPPGEARHGSEVVPGRGNKTCARGWGGQGANTLCAGSPPVSLRLGTRA